MKALRYSLIVVVGCFAFNYSPPAQSRMVVIGWQCSQVPDGFSNSGEVGCRAITVDFGDDGPSRGHDVDKGSGGGGGGSHTVPNPGDAPANQRDASSKDCSEQAGNPVVFSTGNKIEPEADFTSAGEMPLSLTRTYNYYWNGIGIFGRRWLSDYDYKLLFTTDDPTSACYPRPGSSPCDPLNQPIWAQRPDGRKIKFNYSTSPAPGWYEGKASPIARIIRTGATYTLYGEDNTVEVYDANGFPSSITNAQGIGWAFAYTGNHYLTRVTHSSGRYVTFGWSNGLLADITDPSGNVYHYWYATIPVTSAAVTPPRPMTSRTSTGSGLISPMRMPVMDDPPPTPPNPPIQTMVALLTGVTQPGTPGTAFNYQYEDTRFRTALTGKTINGVRYSWFAYDANGRAIETKHANSAERYQFAYTLNSNNDIATATVTNPLGKITTYQFDAKGNQTSVTGVASTHCPATYKATVYDATGYPSGVTDFRDNITTFDYAATGQLLQRVTAADTPLAQTTNYVWDVPHNRISKETLVGDHDTTYTYDANNRLASVGVKNLSTKVAANTGQVRTTTYTYTTHPNGLLASMVVNGPLAGSGDAITLTYASTGDLLTIKNSLGQTTTYGGYNGLGAPGSITGPNGDKHTYIYDARGRVVDVQTNRNGGTQHTYYEYDGFGRVSRVTQPDGHTHSYQYDVAGRLTSEHEPEGGGKFAQTVYTYNAMSLPTSVKQQRVYAEPQRGTVP